MHLGLVQPDPASKIKLRQCVKAAIIRAGKVLVIKRTVVFANGGEVTVCTLPGGGVVDGETWEEALGRESGEEITIVILESKLLFSERNTRRPEGIPARSDLKFQDEHYYHVLKFDGEPMVGPELLKKMEEYPNERYELEWIPTEDFLDQPNFRYRDGPRRLAEDHLPRLVTEAESAKSSAVAVI